MKGWLGFVMIGCLTLEVRAVPTSTEVRQRLEAIVTKMQTLQFCNSGGCRFQNIQLTLTPEAKQKGYQATLKADIERRSRTLDQARYTFSFSAASGWQLLGGVESTDINETVYKADRYESHSVYSRRANQGQVTSLNTGYKQLYYSVLNQGRERR